MFENNSKLLKNFVIYIRKLTRSNLETQVACNCSEHFPIWLYCRCCKKHLARLWSWVKYKKFPLSMFYRKVYSKKQHVIFAMQQGLNNSFKWNKRICAIWQTERFPLHNWRISFSPLAFFLSLSLVLSFPNTLSLETQCKIRKESIFTKMSFYSNLTGSSYFTTYNTVDPHLNELWRDK